MPSSVMKAGAITDIPSVTAGVRVVKRQVYDAGEEARRMVAKASEIAAAILADAEAHRAAIFEESRQKGYQEGLANWNEVVADALHAKEEYLADAESDVLRLSVRIAGKIIGEQLRLEPGTIASIVREALRSAPRERRLMIQVNPSEVDAANRHLRKVLEGATFQPPEIEIAGVESVAPGGCIIVSELGRVDAQLATQLQSIERVLLKARR